MISKRNRYWIAKLLAEQPQPKREELPKEQRPAVYVADVVCIYRPGGSHPVERGAVDGYGKRTIEYI